MRTLSHDEARRVYDRIGSRQDTQAFYEDVATNRILALGDLGTAAAVFEFGCGTGRFAEKMLRDHLGPDAWYSGVDVSPVMAELATTRLAKYGDRARIRQTDGTPVLPEPDASCDRFVSNFVFDLLSEADITALISEAHRILRPGGLFCVSGLSHGHGPLSRAIIGVWSRIHRLRPALVGGCRPVDLGGFVADSRWKLRHIEPRSPFGFPCEVVVAERSP